MSDSRKQAFNENKMRQLISDSLKMSDVPTTKQEEENILSEIRENKSWSGQVAAYLGNHSLPKADRAVLVAKKLDEWIKTIRSNAARGKSAGHEADDGEGAYTKVK